MKSFINKNGRRLLVCALIAAAIALVFVCPVFADAIDDVVNPVVDLINRILSPLLAVVGALGSIYCVFLGIKFAKAEEPQDREKAKQHLKNAIIGFVLIFVLMLALKLLMPAMQEWVKNNGRSAALLSFFK